MFLGLKSNTILKFELPSSKNEKVKNLAIFESFLKNFESPNQNSGF